MTGPFEDIELRANLEDAGEIQKLRATSYIINELIPEGLMTISGASGAGKSTGLIPLAMHATGLIEHETLAAPYKRKVHYFAEDVEQARRVQYTYLHHLGHKTNALDAWFEVHLARRHALTGPNGTDLPTMENLAALATTSYTIDSELPAGSNIVPPLIVLDTSAANLAIESENENGLVSAFMAQFKNLLSDCSIWLITHVSKESSRGKSDYLTARGAGAYEADAQGTFVFYKEGETRFLEARKRRDSGYFSAVQVDCSYTNLILPDKYEQPRRETLVVPELNALTFDDLNDLKQSNKDEATAEAIEQVYRETEAVMRQRKEAGEPIGINVVAPLINKRDIGQATWRNRIHKPIAAMLNETRRYGD